MAGAVACASAGVLVAVIASVASCSSFASDDPPPPDVEGGGGETGSSCSPDLTKDPDNCGQCGVVCHADDVCDNGTCRSGCADKKIYVSFTTGDDASNGCFAVRPMKTIGAAI